MSTTTCLHILEKRKVTCPCRELKTASSSPRPSHYTACSIPVQPTNILDHKKEMGSPPQQNPDRKLPTNGYVATEWELDCTNIFESCWTKQTAIGKVAYVSYFMRIDTGVSVKSKSISARLARRKFFGHFRTDPRLQLSK